jgi:hypothetical protein
LRNNDWKRVRKSLKLYRYRYRIIYFHCEAESTGITGDEMGEMDTPNIASLILQKKIELVDINSKAFRIS